MGDNRIGMLALIASPQPCDQCPEPMEGPHNPECYRYVEPASERWTIGKNGWDVSDEATREDI